MNDAFTKHIVLRHVPVTQKQNHEQRKRPLATFKKTETDTSLLT